jgi:hypothetical protein
MPGTFPSPHRPAVNRVVAIGAVAAACALAAPPPRAVAGGFEYGLQGFGAVARGGADVAHVEDPSALYLNVAGIGKLDEVQVLLETNLVFLESGVRLHGNEDPLTGRTLDAWSVDGEVVEYPRVENDDPPFPGPMVAASFGVPGVEGLVLGLGVFGPAAVGNYTYEREITVDTSHGPAGVPGPQRYDLVYERVLFYWPTLALACRLAPGLVVGMGFQWGVIDLTYSIAGSVARVRSPSSYSSDFLATVRAVDPFVPAMLFGVQYAPLEWLEVGASLRVSDAIRAGAERVTVVMSPWSEDPIHSDDPSLEWMDDPEGDFRRPTGRVWFDWPPVQLRLGVRFALPRLAPGEGDGLPAHVKERFDVELAFFWENTGTLDAMSMQVRGQVPYGRSPGQATEFNVDNDGVFGIQRGWKDCWSLRLGGNVNVLEGMLTFGVGGFYDAGAAPPAYTRLDYAAFDRWGLTTGVAVRVWRLELRAAYAHFFYPERRVDEGRIQHLQGFGDEGNVINNGTYTASIDVLTLGVLGRF